MVDKDIGTEFCDDDPSYLRWIADNSHGYALNVRAKSDPSYMVVHRASCPSISVKRDEEAYTDKAYRKVCAVSVAHLRSWACLHGRPDGSFSKACGICKPLLGGRMGNAADENASERRQKPGSTDGQIT